MSEEKQPQETAAEAQEKAQKGKSKKKHVRLTTSQWKRMGMLYELGEATLKELSEKYGPRQEHISRRLKKMGFKRHARVKEQSKKVEKAFEKAIDDDAKLWADRIKKTREEHYEQITTLNRLAITEIALAKQEGRAFATVEPNLKAIQRAVAINKTTREERYSILGLDNEDESDDLPELTIRDLTEAEVDDIRQAQEAKVGDEFDPMEVLTTYAEQESDD